MNQSRKNKPLFIGATHGDEPIGVEVLDSLSKERTDFDWMIGNPEAYKRGTRCFDGDLNRSAPGSLDAPTYAQRRAAEVLTLANDYECVIDIHGSQKDNGVFIILCNDKKENFELAACFDIDRIVVIPSIRPELMGPLSEFFTCGLEIECGKKDDPLIKKELNRVLVDFLDSQNERKSKTKQLLKQKEIYRVYDALTKEECVKNGIKEEDAKKMKEFGLVKIKNEEFYTIFVGSYESVVCYKMKRVN